jgi:LPXTG-motif cell wall-anchored protein
MLKRTITAAALAAGLAVVLTAAPAAAQQYPPAVNSLTCDDTTPDAGQTISCTAQTFAAGATVTFTLGSEPVVVGSGAAGQNGVVTTDVTIPADTPAGPHTLTASGAAPDGSTLTLTLALTVGGDGQGAGDDDQGGNLPNTGDDSSIPLAKLGLGLAALGGIITALAAKRRKAAAMATG